MSVFSLINNLYFYPRKWGPGGGGQRRIQKAAGGVSRPFGRVRKGPPIPLVEFGGTPEKIETRV